MSAPCIIRIVILSLVILFELCNNYVGGDNNDVVDIYFNSGFISYNSMRHIKLAYELEYPNIHFVSTDTQPKSDNQVKQQIFTKTQDFVVVAQPLTSYEVSIHNNLSAFPALATALVPIYRLDELGLLAPSIIFSREVLARIFYGNITYWNDAAIQYDNPNIILPNVEISVVVPYNGARDLIWTRAMSKFSIQFKNKIGITDHPAWPHHFIHIEANAIQSYVLLHNGAISFSTLGDALAVDLSIGKMINLAGHIVEANVQTINFGVIELATTAIDRNNHIAAVDLDLTDASGTSAYPVIAASYLIIDAEHSRSTCTVRRNVVEFWLWLFESAVAKSVLAADSTIVMPEIVSSSLDIINRLSAQIKCFDGSLAKPNIINHETINIFSTPRIAALGSLITRFYSRLYPQYRFNHNSIHGTVAFQSVIRNEVNLAFIFKQEIEAIDYNNAIVRDNPLILPTFVVNLLPIHHLEIIPGKFLTEAVILDIDTLAKIYLGHINSWLDNSILAMNPALATLLANTSDAPITVLVSCSSNGASVAESFYNLLFKHSQYAREYLHDNNPYIPWLNKDCTNMRTINGNNISMGYIVSAQSETQLSSLMDYIPGSITYEQGFHDLHDHAAVIQVKIGNQVYTPSLQSMHKCVTNAAVNENDELNIVHLSGGECYPFTEVIYTIIKNGFNGNDVGSGNITLSLAKFLFTEERLDATIQDNGLFRLSYNQMFQRYLVNKLHNVLCDGDNCLIVLPVIWSLNNGIRVFGLFMSCLGIFSCVCALILVIKHRLSPVIRSASVPFVSSTIIGVIMLFISCIFLVLPASNGICSSWSWTLNLGFSITFAPLFAKTWRIYRIFGRKQLKVVKLSNKMLGMITAAFIAIELLILIIWNVTESRGMQLVIMKQIKGVDPPRSHEYDHCFTSGTGTDYLIALIIYKCIMLLFGGLMAFSVRKVNSTFNESQQLGWCIYNVIFSCIIVIPIIIFVNAIGDVLIMLLTCLILWISVFTSIVLLVPKFIILYNPDQALIHSEQSSQRSVTQGYSFLSVLHMTSDVLSKYIIAIETHLVQAKNRLTQLRSFGDDNPKGNTLNDSYKTGTNNSGLGRSNKTQDPNNNSGLHGSNKGSLLGSVPINFAKGTQNNAGCNTARESTILKMQCNNNKKSNSNGSPPSVAPTNEVNKFSAKLFAKSTAANNKPHHDHSASNSHNANNNPVNNINTTGNSANRYRVLKNQPSNTTDNDNDNIVNTNESAETKQHESQNSAVNVVNRNQTPTITGVLNNYTSANINTIEGICNNTNNNNHNDNNNSPGDDNQTQVPGTVNANENVNINTNIS